MLQESPKLKGLKKTKAGRKPSSTLPYTKSKTKKMTKGEPMQNPLSYPRQISFNY